MKTLQFECHIPFSQRPDWLLLFVACARSCFSGKYEQGEQQSALNAISIMLDEQSLISMMLHAQEK